jgi:hypothetical protein
MSSLWSVEVEHIAAAVVTLRVRAVHPDTGDLNRNASFALRLFADREPRAARLLQEEGEGAYQDDAAVGRVARRVIADVTVTGCRNMPFDERATKRGITDDLRGRGLDPADAESWDAAFVHAWRAFWRDPGRVPSAVMTIHFADTSWLTGLVVGDRWDSPAYC